MCSQLKTCEEVGSGTAGPIRISLESTKLVLRASEHLLVKKNQGPVRGILDCEILSQVDAVTRVGDSDNVFINFEIIFLPKAQQRKHMILTERYNT